MPLIDDRIVEPNGVLAAEIRMERGKLGPQVLVGDFEETLHGRGVETLLARTRPARVHENGHALELCEVLANLLCREVREMPVRARSDHNHLQQRRQPIFLFLYRGHLVHAR